MCNFTYGSHRIIHHDEKPSLHDLLSYDEVQELQNNHATDISDFASKDNIQNDHHLYGQSRYKKMYDWLHYSDVAHGLCVKSERFSMENHQCQQEYRTQSFLGHTGV